MNRVVSLFAVALVACTTSAAESPGPLVIPASQYFEGNDGPWSTFDIRVGNPEQYLRVLVSTAAPFPLVPLSGDACSNDVFATVPKDCAVSRGKLFDPKASSSWKDIGLYGINEDGVGLEANLEYTQRVQFGSDHLGIGLMGPGLDNQIVGSIATPQPFYLGIIGLNSQPLNFSILGNETSASFVTALKDANKISGISWSYTAGAKYRLKEVYGQLIFSGYDRSRFRENPVSFSMAEDLTRDLVVGLQSISFSGSKSASLLSNPIDIFIDSTDPNIWLPDDACDAFEEAFGLTLDTKSGLYLVNDSHRNTLLDSNAEVSFRLSDRKSGGETVAVVLPYAAFDLVAKAPLVDQTSHYFPIKRAKNAKQYTLGRVFLQEAYLSVDYENKVFNVSACVWNQGAAEDIVPILSGDGNGGGSSSPGSSSSLSKGTIAGIVVGAVLGALLIAAIITVFVLRKRRKWLRVSFAASRKEPETDWTVIGGPMLNTPSQRASTVDGSMPYSAADVSGRASGSSPAHTNSTPGPAVQNGGQTPMVELDGRESYMGIPAPAVGQHLAVPAVAESPAGVFELPGTNPARHGQTTATDGNSPRQLSPSSMGSTERSGGEHGSPDSSQERQAAASEGGSDMISPDSPVYRKRAF